MKTFWQFYEEIGGPPGGMPGAPPGGGMGDPMGGGLPGMGGGAPPMGGGLGGPPPMGGGLGGPPMGGMGGGGGGAEPATQLKPMDVWQVLNRILDGKKIDTKIKSGQENGDMLQGGQPPQELSPPSQPAPPMGAPPPGAPPQQPPMM